MQISSSGMYAQAFPTHFQHLIQSDTAHQMREAYQKTKNEKQLKGALVLKTVSSIIQEHTFPLVHSPSPVPIPVSPWFKQTAMITGTTAAIGAVSAAMFAHSAQEGAIYGAIGGAAGGAIIGHFVSMGSKALQYALPAGIGLISGALGGYLVSQGFQNTSNQKQQEIEKEQTFTLTN